MRRQRLRRRRRLRGHEVTQGKNIDGDHGHEDGEDDGDHDGDNGCDVQVVATMTRIMATMTLTSDRADEDDGDADDDKGDDHAQVRAFLESCLLPELSLPIRRRSTWKVWQDFASGDDDDDDDAYHW